MRDTPETLTQTEVRDTLKITQGELDRLAANGRLHFVKYLKVYDPTSRAPLGGSYHPKWVELDQDLIHQLGSERNVLAVRRVEFMFRDLRGGKQEVNIAEYPKLDLDSFLVLKSDVEKLKSMGQFAQTEETFIATGSIGATDARDADQSSESESPQAGTQLKTDDEFPQIDSAAREVRFNGKDFRLTQQQIKCVEILRDKFKLYKDGKVQSPNMHHKEVCIMAGSASSNPRLDDAFRGQPEAFEHLIFRDKSNNGMYRLNVSL